MGGAPDDGAAGGGRSLGALLRHAELEGGDQRHEPPQAQDGPGLRVVPRARFFGCRPDGYRRLNRGWLEAAEEGPPGGPVWDRTAFLTAIELDGLDRHVKLVRLPLEIEPELSAAAIGEMEALRRDGLLSELRGGRATDLPRPLSEETRDRVRESCPGLLALVERVEAVLAGSHLFVRAVKLDDARASTTRPDDDLAAPHLHLDAGESGLDEYDEPVYQFYANAGSRPRQFRLLPVPLPEMIASLEEAGRLTAEEARRLRANEILARFRAAFDVAEEIVPVPTACVAIFDGRTFAHDAGKADPEALLAGRFEPAEEPDLVLALDTVRTAHHEGLYDPALPLLG